LEGQRFSVLDDRVLAGVFNARRSAIATVPLIKVVGGHLWAFWQRPSTG
jgi:hypothetical protein